MYQLLLVFRQNQFQVSLISQWDQVLSQKIAVGSASWYIKGLVFGSD